MSKRSLCRRSSFTLIEVVIVLVILVMMASIAAPAYMKHLKTARINTAKTQISMLDQALTDYKLEVGSYPENSAGLEALITNVEGLEQWDGPYLKPRVPLDPWGNEYVYVYPGEHGDFDLVCYGADGLEGGEGENADICNWE